MILPRVNCLHERKKSARPDGIKCIVMAPTPELALRIPEVFLEIGKHTRVKTLCVFGGVEQAPQIARLEKGIDVLIATPGCMFDLVSQGHIKLDQVEILAGDVAQLARVLDWQSRGRGFEPHLLHKKA